ncbi:MAG: ABC transporter ATP-binding protein [Lachnospiraceae bacterium]
MEKRENAKDIKEFTGMNKLLKSQFIQFLKNRLNEGTFRDFFDDWKWIFTYSKKYKWVIALYLLLGIFSSTLSLASSVVSKYMIDIIVNRKTSQLWLLVLIMIFSTVFSLLFSSIVDRLALKISIYVNNDIQADIFEKIIDAEWQKINEYGNGDLLNRFNSDIGTVANNAVNWLPNLIINVYTFIATFIVICYYDMTMALIALLSAPFLLLSSRYLMRKMRHYREKVLKMNSDMMSFEVEAFYNFDTIKSFGIMDHYNQKLKGWQQKYKEYNLEYNMFSIKTNVWMSLLTTMVSFAAFGYCLFRLWTNSITYGTMTLFLQQRSKLSSNFDSLVKIIPGMLNSAVSAHRVREIVELPKEKHDPEAARELEELADQGLIVQMRNVHFSYAEKQQVLTKSDFIAKPNEIVALVGASGEGKTTMLRMILGLIHPEIGDAVLIANNGKEVPVNADVRKLFSYVPQGNTILSGTIADNMRMVKEDASDKEIIEALEIACAWDFVKKIDKGIYGKLGERGRGVSEGQAQRIAIARAILRDAPILLLDEATSALDVETERKVLRNIIQRRPNKTCIVSTHRPSVLNMCQRVYRIMETKVTELDEEMSSRMVQDF